MHAHPSHYANAAHWLRYSNINHLGDVGELTQTQRGEVKSKRVRRYEETGSDGRNLPYSIILIPVLKKKTPIKYIYTINDVK